MGFHVVQPSVWLMHNNNNTSAGSTALLHALCEAKPKMRGCHRRTNRASTSTFSRWNSFFVVVFYQTKNCVLLGKWCCWNNARRWSPSRCVDDLLMRFLESCKDTQETKKKCVYWRDAISGPMRTKGICRRRGSTLTRGGWVSKFRWVTLLSTTFHLRKFVLLLAPAITCRNFQIRKFQSRRKSNRRLSRRYLKG